MSRKSNKPTPKMYFGTDQHDAIVKYQNEENENTKKEIYINEILPAFNKLSENLIYIHGFKSHESFESLRSDCVTFLYETLPKFDASRGTKAFSYFNVVAKNWLIIQNKKKVKNDIRNVSMDDTMSLNSRDISTIETHQSAPPQDYEIIKKESLESLFKLMKEIRKKLHTDNEIACMDAIITLFTKIEDLDLLNKRAVFVYMRDLSNLSPKQLSVAMSVIRRHYKDMVVSDDFDIFF